VVDLLENNRIAGQEEIKEAIDEGQVDADKQNDWLGDKHTERTAEVLLEEFAQVDFDFFLFGVDAPVTCPAAELGSFADLFNVLEFCTNQG